MIGGERGLGLMVSLVVGSWDAVVNSCFGFVAICDWACGGIVVVLCIGRCGLVVVLGYGCGGIVVVLSFDRGDRGCSGICYCGEGVSLQNNNNNKRKKKSLETVRKHLPNRFCCSKH